MAAAAGSSSESPVYAFSMETTQADSSTSKTDAKTSIKTALRHAMASAIDDRGMLVSFEERATMTESMRFKASLIQIVDEEGSLEMYEGHEHFFLAAGMSSLGDDFVKIRLLFDSDGCVVTDRDLFKAVVHSQSHKRRRITFKGSTNDLVQTHRHYMEVIRPELIKAQVEKYHLALAAKRDCEAHGMYEGPIVRLINRVLSDSEMKKLF